MFGVLNGMVELFWYNPTDRMVEPFYLISTTVCWSFISMVGTFYLISGHILKNSTYSVHSQESKDIQVT